MCRAVVMGLCTLSWLRLANAQADPPNRLAENTAFLGEGSAPSPTSSAQLVSQLTARFDRQQAELERLRRELEAERQKREEERVAVQRQLRELRQATQETIEQGPLVHTKARPRLVLTGFADFDYVHRQSSSDQLSSAGEPLNEDRFLLRRARLKALVEYHILSGTLELDVNTVRGPQARPIGVDVSLRWPPPAGDQPPAVMATLGIFKMPFGSEVMLEGDTQRHFTERSTIVRALFPGEYDLGARIQGAFRSFCYAVALMNGNPLGERAFPTRDPNGSKDWLGRVGVDLMAWGRLKIVAGVSALFGTGFDPGKAAVKDSLAWQDSNHNRALEPDEVVGLAGSVAVPAKNFNRSAFGGDLRLSFALPRLGALTLYGELICATNLDRALQPASPVAQGRDLRELGGYFAFTQELTRYAMFGMRYDVYNPDLDASVRQGKNSSAYDASYSTLAIAASLRYPAIGRLIVEYDANSNHLGHDDHGLPLEQHDDAFLLRGEVAF